MFTDAAYFVFGMIIGGIVAVFQYAAFIAGITRGLKNAGKFGGSFAGLTIYCEIEQEHEYKDGEQLPLMRLTCPTAGCVFRNGHSGGCANADGDELFGAGKPND